ncbi:MAG: hypothetical protein H6558_19380 [Lewinellaceae bacterium]|nr:hypothetical protein [Lewinellaceae bacterium]
MKKLIFCWFLAVVFLTTANAQYGTVRTGYEGDFFSLEGALELFRQSYSLRDFERKLNTQENWVNNLDLDYDGRIDYIRVEHRRQGNFHAIILQALVDRYDVQDVAVIEIEIIGRREAVLQIVGDEGLYGEDVIVEPVEGYSDSRGGYHSDYGDYVNVYYWKPVQYILGRQYVVYVSPYRWHYYPSWWRPWVQCTWSVFSPRIVIYHRHFHIVHRHRVVRVHNFYRPYRSYSHVVVQRTNKVREKHGKPPVHNPAPGVRQDRRPSDYRSRKDFEQRPEGNTRSGTPGRTPSVSRKDTPSSGQREAPQVKQPSRNSTTRSRDNTRSPAPVQKPSVNSRQESPSSRQKADRRTAPQVKQPTRTRTETRNPSVNSRKAAPPSGQKADKRTAPQVKQPSRSTTTRSRATARSSAPAQRPSASSSRTAPASKPKPDRGTSSKSSKQGNSRRKGN